LTTTTARNLEVNGREKKKGGCMQKGNEVDDRQMQDGVYAGAHNIKASHQQDKRRRIRRRRRMLNVDR
jgi:hypothetical protein